MLNWSIIYFLDTPQIFSLINSQFQDREPIPGFIFHPTRIFSGFMYSLPVHIISWLDTFTTRLGYSGWTQIHFAPTVSYIGCVYLGRSNPLFSPSLAHFSFPSTLGQERKLSSSQTPTLPLTLAQIPIFVSEIGVSSSWILTSGVRSFSWALVAPAGDSIFALLLLGSWNPSHLGVARWRSWLILVRVPRKFLLPFDSSGNPSLIFVVAWEEGSWKRL